MLIRAAPRPRPRRSAIRRLYIATIRPRPITTSQAATTITISANTWPSPVPVMREKAISARLPAFSISSSESSTTSGLRRVSTPVAPMQKRNAERTTNQLMFTRRASRLSRGRSVFSCVSWSGDWSTVGSPGPSAVPPGMRVGMSSPSDDGPPVPCGIGAWPARSGSSSPPSSSRPRLRRASTTAPTAATSSRNDAASNASRKRSSSSRPISPGEPKPGPTFAPRLSIADSPSRARRCRSRSSSASANSGADLGHARALARRSARPRRRCRRPRTRTAPSPRRRRPRPARPRGTRRAAAGTGSPATAGAPTSASTL